MFWSCWNSYPTTFVDFVVASRVHRPTASRKLIDPGRFVHSPVSAVANDLYWLDAVMVGDFVWQTSWYLGACLAFAQIPAIGCCIWDYSTSTCDCIDLKYTAQSGCDYCVPTVVYMKFDLAVLLANSAHTRATLCPVPADHFPVATDWYRIQQYVHHQSLHHERDNTMLPCWSVDKMSFDCP